MSEVKDFCNQPRVAHTGMGWGVRIDGTDVFESLNQYGFKTLRTLEIVTGLSSEQEAKAYLTQWLSDQLRDFDAQRLRADTAEAELAKLRESHTALIEDRARFPDRPDFVGNMISAHIGNLKAGKESSDSYARNYILKLDAAEQRIARMEAALKYYADKDHFSTDDGMNWDSCSGEPSNILWHEEQPWFIEDGSIARAALNPNSNPEAESHE